MSDQYDERRDGAPPDAGLCSSNAPTPTCSCPKVSRCIEDRCGGCCYCGADWVEPSAEDDAPVDKLAWDVIPVGGHAFAACGPVRHSKADAEGDFPVRASGSATQVNCPVCTGRGMTTTSTLDSRGEVCGISGTFCAGCDGTGRVSSAATPVDPNGYRATLEKIARTPGVPVEIYEYAADALCWARKFRTQADLNKRVDAHALLKEARQRIRDIKIKDEHAYALGLAIGVLYQMRDELKAARCASVDGGSDE